MFLKKHSAFNMTNEDFSKVKLVIAIGNPGSKYEFTRHNAGMILIDAIRKVFPEIANSRYMKSDVFMNNSGVFVSKWMRMYKCKPEELLILHDDLDLEIGKFKLQFGKGPKVHNGLNDIDSKLRTKNYWRLRIGVDNLKERFSGADYVLSKFTNEELELMQTAFTKFHV